jgi:hypothetical protein
MAKALELEKVRKMHTRRWLTLAAGTGILPPGASSFSSSSSIAMRPRHAMVAVLASRPHIGCVRARLAASSTQQRHTAIKRQAGLADAVATRHAEHAAKAEGRGCADNIDATLLVLATARGGNASSPGQGLPPVAQASPPPNLGLRKQLSPRAAAQRTRHGSTRSGRHLGVPTDSIQQTRRWLEAVASPILCPTSSGRWEAHRRVRSRHSGSLRGCSWSSWRSPGPRPAGQGS